MKTSIAILAAALALALFGCGGNDAATSSEEKAGGAATVAEEKDAGAAAGEATTTPEKEPLFPTPATEDDPRFPTISYDGKERRPKPVVEPSGLPPPKRLLVKDLRVGTGPVAHHRDKATIWYIDFYYKNGDEAFFGWRPPVSPLVLDPLGAGMTFAAMEEGIEGMRAGGRRVMLVPADRGFGTGALVVFVDLIRVEP